MEQVFPSFVQQVAEVLCMEFSDTNGDSRRDEDLPPHWYTDATGSDRRLYRFCLMDARIVLDDMAPLCAGLIEAAEESNDRDVVLLWKCANDHDFWYMERTLKGKLVMGHSMYSHVPTDGYERRLLG